MLKNKVFRNFLSLALLQAANVLIPLIQTPYLVRILGPANYGKVGFSMACLSYVALLAEYGFNLTATKRVSIANTISQERVSEVFWNVMYSKLLLGVVGLAGLLVAIAASTKLQDNALLLGLFYFFVLGQILFPQWYFQGMEKMPVITAINISAKVLVLPLTLLLVHHPEDGPVYAAVYAFTYLLSGLIGLTWAIRSVGRIERPRLSRVKHELKDSFSMFLSMLSVNLFTATNTVVLGFIAGDVAVGLFVGADKIIRAVLGLTSPLHNALYPRISASVHRGSPDAQRMLRRLMKFESLATLAASLAIAFLAKYLVLGFLGAKFTGSVPLLQIMAILVFVIAMSYIFGSLTLLPFGRQKAYSRILISASLLHIVVLFVLVPLYGATGAAVSVVFTEALVAASMLFVINSNKLLMIPSGANA
jgi:PST family polysaccharide transporter